MDYTLINRREFCSLVPLLIQIRFQSITRIRLHRNATIFSDSVITQVLAFPLALGIITDTAICTRKLISAAIHLHKLIASASTVRPGLSPCRKCSNV
jgi:hypothetical protein